MSITAKVENETLILTLDNSRKGNSFGLQEAEDLSSALNEYDDNVKGLVFVSAVPGLFCAGGNLKDYIRHGSAEEGYKVNRAITSVLEELSQFSGFKLALVDGDCFGGGMELLSAFDRIHATPASCFGFWQRRVGLTFGWGGWHRWRKKIPEKDLHLLSIEARTFGAHEAFQLGIVDQIISAESLWAQALHWVKQQGALPQKPMRSFKELCDGKEEQLVFENIWWNEEHRERLQQFFRK